MTNLRDWAFLSAFGLLATHELDAVRCAEWRVLPVTRFFPEEIAMAVFILAHIPLFAWLSAMCSAKEQEVQHKSRLIFAGFCCVHVGLHWLFRNDPHYLFAGWLSNGLIGGAGVMGALYLVMTPREKRKI